MTEEIEKLKLMKQICELQFEQTKFVAQNNAMFIKEQAKFDEKQILLMSAGISYLEKATQLMERMEKLLNDYQPLIDRQLKELGL